jgi:hypothetical protein
VLIMDLHDVPTGAAGRKARERVLDPSNIVPLPTAARTRVRQPSGGASGAYRKANPWPGQWHEPVPRDDAGALAFARVLAEKEVARACYELTTAQCHLVRLLDMPAAEQAAQREAHWEAFDAMREATERLAATPAVDRRTLERKAQAIGRIWLRAEGEWYDGLRAAMARDAARLSLPNPAPTAPAERPH